MKNTILGIIVVVLLLAGGYFYFAKDSTAPAPAPTGDTTEKTDTTPVSETENTGTVDESKVMGTSTENGANAAAALPSVKTFTVTGSANMRFTPDTLTAKKGDTVKIVFKNSGGTHDFVIDEFTGAKTKQIAAGTEETIQFVVDKAGSFEYYCSVGKHRANGMKGTLTVTE